MTNFSSYGLEMVFDIQKKQAPVLIGEQGLLSLRKNYHNLKFHISTDHGHNIFSLVVTARALKALDIELEEGVNHRFVQGPLLDLIAKRCISDPAASS